jgi:hypothetical protein
MRRLFSCIVCLLLSPLTGCSLFGYRIHKEPRRAPPEEAARIRFPDSFEGSTPLSGTAARALAVAMNDFIPPGTRPEDEEDQVARCLSQWETFTLSVVQAQDDLFFVRFSPERLPECAPGRLVLDAGAVYAIDGQGRILAVQE